MKELFLTIYETSRSHSKSVFPSLWLFLSFYFNALKSKRLKPIYILFNDLILTELTLSIAIHNRAKLITKLQENFEILENLESNEKF